MEFLELKPHLSDSAASTAAGADIYAVDLEAFDTRVVEESFRRPVLVDFWAEWCPPCLVIGPLLERVVNESAGKLALAKVEVDAGENMKLAGRYQVRGFPTVILLREGEERGRFSGAKPYAFVEHFIESHGGL
jgi:putative thioredoxin